MKKIRAITSILILFIVSFAEGETKSLTKPTGDEFHCLAMFMAEQEAWSAYVNHLDDPDVELYWHIWQASSIATIVACSQLGL